jgi:gamma-glutamylputrescine oxidase
MNRRRFLKLGAGAGAGLALSGLGLERLAPTLWRERVSVEPNLSHWARVPVRPEPSLMEDLVVDTLVIGAGLTGLSSALHLRRVLPDESVVVLDAKQAGNGGSGRSGGFLCSWPSNHDWMWVSGSPEHHVRGYALTAQAMRELEAIAGEAALDAELDMAGVLQLSSPENIGWMREYAATARLLGIPVQLWSADRVRETVGVECAGGLYDPSGGHCHPRNLTLAVKAAAQRAGARVYENSPVVQVEQGDTVRALLTNGRRVRARRLVLGTGAWTTQLGFFRDHLFPVSNYMAVTPPLSEDQRAKAGLHSAAPFHNDRSNLVYMGLTRDRRFTIGGGFARLGFNNGTDTLRHGERAVQALRREIGAFFPSLQAVPFTRTWGGSVGLALDEAPSVGRTSSHGNVFYGVGYAGHGMVTGYLAGRVIAELAADVRGDWEGMPFVNRPLPYVPREPFRSTGGNAYIAALDLLE